MDTLNCAVVQLNTLKYMWTSFGWPFPIHIPALPSLCSAFFTIFPNIFPALRSKSSESLKGSVPTASLVPGHSASLPFYPRAIAPFLRLSFGQKLSHEAGFRTHKSDCALPMPVRFVPSSFQCFDLLFFEVAHSDSMARYRGIQPSVFAPYCGALPSVFLCSHLLACYPHIRAGPQILSSFGNPTMVPFSVSASRRPPSSAAILNVFAYYCIHCVPVSSALSLSVGVYKHLRRRPCVAVFVANCRYV
ncbi:hypothetical protein C8F04DRAFT_1126122 [Mycena alexandri]|uniref:Uncharacterized protein n=1 Tax=Mycena alexandri TaxID=1745969 RepID=A0AAD6WYY5_9AGAR|nr:hypothetical protein C8F04DRAFT_1126122 [Mycena alexandri]